MTTIYERTNEDLKDILSKYDLNDKEILTVLASSDQLLSCYYYNAKRVDAFDKVYETIYYYYLRKWLILYKNVLYPNLTSNSWCINEYYIKNSNFLSSIKPNSEIERLSLSFWTNYFTYKPDNIRIMTPILYHTNPFDNDINSIKKSFYHPLTFYNMDLSKEINIDRQYDILILSNILETIKDKNLLLIIRNNIEKILRTNGICICSFKINQDDSPSFKEEKKILTSNLLEINNIISEYNPLYGKKRCLAYSYIKKQ